MCSTIPPPKKGPLFHIFFNKHFCTTLTCSFRRNLFLVNLVTIARRSTPSKCAPLSAPKKGPTVSDFFQPSMAVMPLPVAFTGSCFGSNSVIVAQRSRPSKCARLSALPKKGELFQFFFSTKRFCNAPTCSFHQYLFLIDLVILAHKSRPPKCGRLSAPPKKTPTVSDFFQPSICVMARPVAFIKTCFWSIWPQ